VQRQGGEDGAPAAAGLLVASGGADGRVCVFSLASSVAAAGGAPALLTVFAEHTRPVIAVAFNAARPELLHSIGADQTLVTYHLRSRRRLRTHVLPPAGPTTTLRSLPTTTSTPFPSSPAAATAAMAGRDVHWTSLSQWVAPGSESELLLGTSDGRLVAVDPDVPDAAVGCLVLEDLLLLPVDGSRGLDKRRLHVTAVRGSPGGRFVAVALANGNVLVLMPPAAGFRLPPGVPPLGAPHGALPLGAFSLAALLPPPAPPAAAGSGGGLGAALTELIWSPDERQLVGCGAEGTVRVLNWYGAEK
jgi:WD40 repeat protein